MNDTKQVSITSRLLKIVFSIYLCLALALTIFHIIVEFRDTKKQIHVELGGLYNTLERSMTLALWELDYRQFDSIVSGALLVPTITGITVYDDQGKFMVGLGDYPKSPEKSANRYITYSNKLIYSGPDVVAETHLAEVSFYSTDQAVFNRVKLGIILVVINAVIKTIALWLIFTYLGRLILHKPLWKLTKATQSTDINSLMNTQVDMGKRPNDEINILANSFNQMLGHLSEAVQERDKAKSELELNNENLKETVKERTAELSKTLRKEEKLNEELKYQADLLNKANKKLYHLATIDELTGLYNRRQFLDKAKAELKRCQRYKHPVSIMMLDVDFFKKINDEYGHAAGDHALKTLASVSIKNLRSHDIIGRIGGEEFAILMPETDIEEAEPLAERLRVGIENADFHIEKMPFNLTISIGLSYVDSDEQSIENAMSQADQALYHAKNNGRNRISNYHKITLV